MQRLPSLPFWSLLLLGVALTAAPVLAKITGAPDTVAAVSPAISTVTTAKTGCTPINPCAIVTPALGSATLPTPDMPAQPSRAASTGATVPTAPNPPAGAAPAQAANPNCPPAGARGGFAGGQRGAGQFAGRGQAGGAGRGQQLAQNGRGGGGQGRGEGRGQGFVRGADGCPRPAGAPGVRGGQAAGPGSR